MDTHEMDRQAKAAYDWFNSETNGKLSFTLILSVGLAEYQRAKRCNNYPTAMAEERKSVYGEGYDKFWLSKAQQIYRERVKITEWRESYNLGVLDPSHLLQEWRKYQRRVKKVEDGLPKYKSELIKQTIKDYKQEGNEIDTSITVEHAKAKTEKLKALAKSNIAEAEKVLRLATPKKAKPKTQASKINEISVDKDADDIFSNVKSRLELIFKVVFDPDLIAPAERNEIFKIILYKYQVHKRECEFGLDEQCLLIKQVAARNLELTKIVKEQRRRLNSPPKRVKPKKQIVEIKTATAGG